MTDQTNNTGETTMENVILSPADFERVADGYIAALCWVGLYRHRVDPAGGTELESVDAAPEEYGLDDLDPALADEIRADIEDFVAGITVEDLDAYLAANSPEQMGHDFYLTRCGHGAGFWDRGLGDLGDRLTELAKPYGDHIVFLEDGIIRA